MVLVLVFLMSLNTVLSNVVIISASKSEAQATLNLLNESGIDVDYEEFGISINAAYNQQSLIPKVVGKHAIYVGSAGQFTNLTSPYLATANSTMFMPTGYRLGFGNDLPDLFPSIPLNATEGLPAMVVLTSPVVSHTSEVDVELPAVDTLAENMELYYIAPALQEALKYDVVLGITDQCSPDAKAQYLKNKDIVANMTAKYILTMLKPKST